MTELFDPLSTIHRAIIDPNDQMPHVKLRARYRNSDDTYSCEAVNEGGVVVVEAQLVNQIVQGLPVSFFSDIRRVKTSVPRHSGMATYIAAGEFCEERGRAFISDSRLSASATHTWGAMVSAGIAREVIGAHPYRMCFTTELLHREIRGDI